MATVQTDGSTAVTRTSTVNNGGTAINVGSSSTVLDNRSLGRDNQGVFGSTVVSNASKDYADLALASGTFAYNNAEPIGVKLTDTLAGSVSNTFLRSGGSDLGSRRSIHRQEKVRTTRTTTAIRAGYWNIYSGTWNTTPTTAVDNFWDIANDTTSATSTDEAATPTRGTPGELTYKLGQETPVSVDYSAKNT
jgi:hypothetical protein